MRKRPVPLADLPAWAQRRGGPTARRSVEVLLALLRELHQDTQGRRPGEVLDVILQRIPYREWLEAQKDGHARLKAVDDLRGVIENAAASDLGTWLIDMQLGEFEGPADAGTKSVTLTTIHGAKGSEWPVVFVIVCEEGLLPHGRRLSAPTSTQGEDEERRLAYVAFSRTQVPLYLVYCRAR
jgi:DNA helicase-2/ATP-dependent DNA helicase PcrA